MAAILFFLDNFLCMIRLFMMMEVDCGNTENMTTVSRVSEKAKLLKPAPTIWNMTSMMMMSTEQ